MGDSHSYPVSSADMGDHKLPIPRLPSREKVVYQKRNRVSRACNTCRSRRVKCSGDRPICGGCTRSGTVCVYESSRKNRMDQITEQNTFLTSVLEEVSMHVGEEDRKRISSALETAAFQLPLPLSPVDPVIDTEMSTENVENLQASSMSHQFQAKSVEQEFAFTAPSPLLLVAEEGYLSYVHNTAASESQPGRAFDSNYHTPVTTPHQRLPQTGLTSGADLSEGLLLSNVGSATAISVSQQTVQLHDALAMCKDITQKAESIFVTNQASSKDLQSEYRTASVLTELEAWRTLVNLDAPPGYTPAEALVLRVVYFSGKISATKPYLQNFCDVGGEMSPSELTLVTTCMNSAHEMTIALPDQPNPQQSDEVTLCCSLIPHLVQAVSVCLLELSAAGMELQRNYTASFDSLKKLVRWLRALRQYDDTAEQAHTKVVSLFRAAANEILRSDQLPGNISGGETAHNTEWFGQNGHV